MPAGLYLIPHVAYTSYGDIVAWLVDYKPWLLALAVDRGHPHNLRQTLALKDGWTLVSTDKEVTTGTAWVGTTVLSGTTTILAYKIHRRHWLYAGNPGHPANLGGRLLREDRRRRRHRHRSIPRPRRAW